MEGRFLINSKFVLLTIFKSFRGMLCGQICTFCFVSGCKEDGRGDKRLG